MALQRPVILMRPGEANNRLAGVLRKEGIECWRWPAFRIELPGKEDCELVQERLDTLDDVEMVILPSPASVAAAAHWVKAWPAHITLATVGEGTAKVIRAAWGDDVKLVYPKGDAVDSGSEALWEILKHRGAPSRVLFLRGQTGREWLPEQFRSIGSDVITMCIYVRVPLELTPEQRHPNGGPRSLSDHLHHEHGRGRRTFPCNPSRLGSPRLGDERDSRHASSSHCPASAGSRLSSY